MRDDTLVVWKRLHQALLYFLHNEANQIISRTFDEWPIFKLFSYVGRTAYVLHPLDGAALRGISKTVELY